jgi:hypothetical protein
MRVFGLAEFADGLSSSNRNAQLHVIKIIELSPGG